MDRDIAGAIEAEKKYIHSKTTSSDRSLSIYDYLRPFGYENLKEYREDRLIYEVRNSGFETVNVTSGQVVENGNCVAFRNTEEGKPCILWNIHHPDVAFLPLSNDIDIPGYVTIRPGYDCEPKHGTILSFDGDLDIVMILPDYVSDYFMYLIRHICEYLSEFSGKDVKLEGNDIMIDGVKVSGTASFTDGEKNVYLCHISFTDNSDKIVEIIPDSVKKPGHIGFMGAEKLLERILSWLP